MGALDINSASPRRYLFEVLEHFATEELQKERLQHFASGEGREDLNLYNQSEGIAGMVAHCDRRRLEISCCFSINRHIPHIKEEMGVSLTNWFIHAD